MSNITKALTPVQHGQVVDYVEQIIGGLDDLALNELLGGSEGDLDKLFYQIFNETQKALYPGVGPLQTFDYLDRLTRSFDEELKRISINYFISTVLPDFEMYIHHIEWGNLVQFYRFLGILAARDHGKSHFFSFAYPLWRLYRYNKNNLGGGITAKENRVSREGMIVTNEFSLAKTFLRFIKEEIELNPILRERLFPKVGSKDWGSEEIICQNKGTITIKGSGSALRGRHPGWIMLDDYLDDSSLYSKNQRDKYISDFYSIVMNMPIPGGQVVSVGTPYHEKDLYSKLKEDKRFKVFEYPAIFPDGTVLWPSRYSLEALLAKKESQGSIVFTREILVKPIMSDATIFPYHILETSFIGMDQYRLAPNIQSFQRKFKKVSMGCDFAISSEIGADYSVFTVLGIDEYDNYWLLAQWRERGASYNQQIAQIRKMNNDFSPDVIMAEDNVFQKVMIQLCNDSGIPVIGHTTGINKYDLKSGLPALATLFEQGKIKFPRGDGYSKDVTDTICSEASGITWTDGKLENTNDHDDSVISLWIAIKAGVYVTEEFSFSFM